jgi:hypothetical protein
MASSLQQGINAAKAGRMKEALDHLKDAIIDEPQNADVWVWIAAIIDDLDKQEIFLEKALEIDPNNIPAQRGLAYLRKRKKNETSYQGEHLSDHTKPISPFPAGKQAKPASPASNWVRLEDGDLDDLDGKGSKKVWKSADTDKNNEKGLPRLSLFEISLLGVVVIVFCFIGLLVASSVFGFDLPLDFFRANHPRLSTQPPYSGVFLYENGTFCDVQKYSGLPNQLTGIPDSTEATPLIVFWQPDTSLTNLRLVYETGEIIPIDQFEGKNEAKLIQPARSLQAGLYCLQQLPESNKPEEAFYWCFRIIPITPEE